MLNSGSQQLMDFLKTYIGANGYAPTYQEMMDGVDVRSKNTVFKRLESLEKAGMIRRLAGNSRAIQILQTS